MATYAIAADYNFVNVGNVELPDGVTWGDIGEWYVKWNTFHYCIKNSPDDWQELPIDDADPEIDWKRPCGVRVYSVDDDGTPSDDPIDEQA